MRECPGAAEATVFFLYDGNCNVDAVVDEGGNLVKQFTYDVFGAVREVLVGSGAETVGFSGGVGHITDLENSLIYMRARYYDPSIGRFISEDPAGNGTNLYIYCGNNPVNMVDPSGCSPFENGPSYADWLCCYLSALAMVLGGIGMRCLAAGEMIMGMGQALDLSCPIFGAAAARYQAVGGAMLATGTQLTTAALLLAIAAGLCTIFNDDISEGIGYIDDYVTSAASAASGVW